MDGTTMVLEVWIRARLAQSMFSSCTLMKLGPRFSLHHIDDYSFNHDHILQSSSCFNNNLKNNWGKNHLTCLFHTPGCVKWQLAMAGGKFKINIMAIPLWQHNTQNRETWAPKHWAMCLIMWYPGCCCSYSFENALNLKKILNPNILTNCIELNGIWESVHMFGQGDRTLHMGTAFPSTLSI